jgi:filamentous hemagglutinin family protein
MTSAHCRFYLTIALITASGSIATPGWSQIVPDSSVNSLVTLKGNTLQIDGGRIAGTNLFHSFQDFSVPTGTAAFFNNSLSVENIITRITGSKISNIDGLIRANGTANLFLLNTNGLIFGPNARLNIGGSFVGTTANSIQFADGGEFSATTTTTPPLLTVSVPVGLQFEPNPGEIFVKNTGHQLSFAINPFASSPDRSHNPIGLGVNEGNTLALIGGNITLEGGVLNAPSGHIELGSAGNGTIRFKTSDWSFDYTQLQQFGNIQLFRQSLADGSGSPAGSIHFQGRNISFNDGSAALLINQGRENAGDISVHASELLTLRGVGSEAFPQSLLRADNFGAGNGGNILVSASQVLLQEGGSLHGFNFGQGIGSHIAVEIQEGLEIVGLSPLSGFASSVNTRTAGSGNSGDVRVVAGTLQILDGAVIGNSSSGVGRGGNTTINVSDFIEIKGEDPQSLAESVIVAGTFSEANAGQLTINTPKLRVRDGGGIVASTVNSGSGGNLIINVSDTIEVSGVGPFSQLPSRIGARAELLAPPIRQLFGLPNVITGNIGQLVINTPRLQVTNGAIVGVDHEGIGDAGDLQINADSIFLDRSGGIVATTLSGEGGNINLQANSLILRRGGNITATARGTGNGGNITLNVPVIAGLENSDITANAVQGAGGKIDITTQGIFGLEFREQPTAQSDITASSQFGVSGTVSISTPDVQPDATLINLPATLIDPNQNITQGCDSVHQNQFIATGRGGLPPNPAQRLEAEERPWADVRDLSGFRQRGTQASVSPSTKPRLLEANAWHLNQQGQVEIYMAQTGTANFLQPTCSGTPLTYQ